MSRVTKLLSGAAVLLGATLFAAPALAQDADPAPASDPPAANVALDLDQDDAGGFVIVGKEHLPDFTVLMDRENLSRAYDLELEEEFLPKIIEAVGKEPF